MSRTLYGWTHEELCIEFGHCYHHIERLGMLTCCVCHIFKDDTDNDDRENDCAS